VGLTPHHIAVERAIGVVETVERKFDDLKAKGDLREMNAAFKAARAVEPSLRYADFLWAKKAAMLEELARRIVAPPGSQLEPKGF
jgi:hypothetical protein